MSKKKKRGRSGGYEKNVYGKRKKGGPREGGGKEITQGKEPVEDANMGPKKKSGKKKKRLGGGGQKRKCNGGNLKNA